MKSSQLEDEPGKVNGPRAMHESAEWLLTQFPDMHMKIEAMISEGDTVAVRILSEGTNLGPLNGVVPPTGKRFTARQSHWYRVADGKLAEHWATREDLPTMLHSSASSNLRAGRHPEYEDGPRTAPTGTDNAHLKPEACNL